MRYIVLCIVLLFFCQTAYADRYLIQDTGGRHHIVNYRPSDDTLTIVGNEIVNGYIESDYMQLGINETTQGASDTAYVIDMNKPMQVLTTGNDTLYLSISNLTANKTKTVNLIIKSTVAVTRLVFASTWDGDNDNWLDVPPSSIAINKRAILSITSYDSTDADIVVGYKVLQ